MTPTLLLPTTLQKTRQPSIGPSSSVSAICRPPTKPGEVFFDDLVKLVEENQNPEHSITVQHFKFYSRCCQPGKTVCTYIAELRNIAERCKFKSALCDKVINGIQVPQIQSRLLTESELEFKQAFEPA